MVHISVSILDLDFLNLDRNLKELEMLGVTHIHIDIIDTSFANNISFGPGIINQILQYNFIFDLHFMVDKPLPLVKSLDCKRVERIAVHSHYAEVFSYFGGQGPIIGYAVHPAETPQPTEAEYILVMLVEPGCGGQALIPGCVSKIKEYKAMGKFVGVDGGVSADNIELLNGADLIVVGSALTRSDIKEEYYKDLIKRVRHHL